MRTTRFTHPAAVDAWDQWFRWRDADCLRDRTVDATWLRVAESVAPAGGDHARWVLRYLDAFSRWQLVPDERLLAGAGTGMAMAHLHAPTAMLNAAAFIVAPGTAQARLDEDGFVATAALAVRLLDDALLATGSRVDGEGILRIGLIGFADALNLLGLDYGDRRAPAFAARLGHLLDHGTLDGLTGLVAERGGTQVTRDYLRRLKTRGSPCELVQRLAQAGTRHQRLTAIEPHPRLAQLANDASDALEPRPGHVGGATTGAAAVAAIRQAIHHAIAPWIDAPPVGAATP